MHILATIPFVLIVLGCSATGPAGNCQAELENVARCFHEAATILQDQPESPDRFAPFLATAARRATATNRDTGIADFGALRWDTTGESLITSSGDFIKCRLAQQSHDNYGPEGSAWITEYEFFVPGTETLSRATIEFRMN